MIGNEIGIVRHSVRDEVLPFKQVDVVVVDADPADAVGDFHGDPFLSVEADGTPQTP